MDKKLNEAFEAGKVKPPSELATGLVFTAVALIIALVWRNEPPVPWWALGIAAALAAFSLVAPRPLKFTNTMRPSVITPMSWMSRSPAVCATRGT